MCLVKSQKRTAKALRIGLAQAPLRQINCATCIRLCQLKLVTGLFLVEGALGPGGVDLCSTHFLVSVLLGFARVGQNQWCNFGVGEFTTHVSLLSGDWDVHWGYGVLTHGQMVLVSRQLAWDSLQAQEADAGTEGSVDDGDEATERSRRISRLARARGQEDFQSTKENMLYAITSGQTPSFMQLLQAKLFEIQASYCMGRVRPEGSALLDHAAPRKTFFFFGLAGIEHVNANSNSGLCSGKNLKATRSAPWMQMQLKVRCHLAAITSQGSLHKHEKERCTADREPRHVQNVLRLPFPYLV